MEFELIIKGGTVVDGAKSKPARQDIGIRDGIIEAIGTIEGAAGQVIDATGRVVCPGFIDTHSHSDLVLFSDPVLQPKTFQGITTEVIGQDGMGVAPLSGKYIKAWKKSMSSLAGNCDVDWNWCSVSEYLKEVDKQALGPNIAFLAPHSNIRMCAMGLDNRKPSADELRCMEKLLEQCIEEGAYGMSTGMIYPPCCYAGTDEFVALGKVLAKTGTAFVTHQRSEADAILESCDEILSIGRQSGCRIHFSHLKVCGKKNWSKLDPMLCKFDEAENEGVCLSFDQYPYVAGSTMMSVIFPPWAHDGGVPRLLERLHNPELRKRMIFDIEHGIEGWDNFVDFAGLDGIFVASVKTQANKSAAGKSLIELGAERGKPPLEAVMDLIVEEDNAVGLVDFYGTEEHLVKIMQRPEHNVGSDGVIGDKPHPRLYGTYPRILGKYVREGVLDLPDAVHKMTGKAAEVLGLKGRGIIRKGYAADIVVFDAGSVEDTATYTDPKQFPHGIEHVIVNGRVLIEHGKSNPVKAGRVLKFSGR